MAFNRYETLTKHYIKELEAWDWKAVKKSALSNCFVEDGQIIASCWLGSTMGLFPSGKIYAPWTSNQTRSDVVKDECFNDALEQIANEHDMFIIGSECGDGLCAQFIIDNPEDVISYITSDEEEKALELFAED